MTKDEWKAVLFASFLIGVTSLVADVSLSLLFRPTVAQAQPKEQETRADGRWEYRVVYFKSVYGLNDKTNAASEENADKATEQFNKLGQDGWEFAGTLGVSHYAVFKRPKR
jgi:hypothetical protein